VRLKAAIITPGEPLAKTGFPRKTHIAYKPC